MTRKERYACVIDWFSRNKPEAETELHYNNGFELLVAVILSAQCTDKRVNQVTPDLFEAFPGPEVMAAAKPEEIFPFIRSVSYPNNKARHLAGMARRLMDDFGGRIPEEPEQLRTLPGVGRKTAHVVASVLYNREVLPVDTHVFRVAARLGLTIKAKTPLETEKQLVKYLPPALLPKAHHWLILHGRYICRARTPLCDACGLKHCCAWYKRNRAVSAKGK